MDQNGGIFRTLVLCSSYDNCTPAQTRSFIFSHWDQHRFFQWHNIGGMEFDNKKRKRKREIEGGREGAQVRLRKLEVEISSKNRVGLIKRKTTTCQWQLSYFDRFLITFGYWSLISRQSSSFVVPFFGVKNRKISTFFLVVNILLRSYYATSYI